MKRVYNAAAMQFITMFENITKVITKDCIVQNNQIVFIVKMSDVGMAVGPKGLNVRKLEQKLNKKIKIAGYSENIIEFIKSLVAPLQLKEVAEEEGIVVMTAKDLKTRGLLIGRNASILRSFEQIIQRFFPIKELKVK